MGGMLTLRGVVLLGVVAFAAAMNPQRQTPTPQVPQQVVVSPPRPLPQVVSCPCGDCPCKQQVKAISADIDRLHTSIAVMKDVTLPLLQSLNAASEQQSVPVPQTSAAEDKLETLHEIKDKALRSVQKQFAARFPSQLTGRPKPVDLAPPSDEEELGTVADLVASAGSNLKLPRTIIPYSANHLRNDALAAWLDAPEDPAAVKAAKPSEAVLAIQQFHRLVKKRAHAAMEGLKHAIKGRMNTLMQRYFRGEHHVLHAEHLLVDEMERDEFGKTKAPTFQQLLRKLEQRDAEDDVAIDTSLEDGQKDSSSSDDQKQEQSDAESKMEQCGDDEECLKKQLNDGAALDVVHNLFPALNVTALASAQQREELPPHWDYFKQGNDWPGLCKFGESQSPINIDTNVAKRIGTRKQVKMSQPSPYRAQFNYLPLKNVQMVNEGHMLVMDLEKIPSGLLVIPNDKSTWRMVRIEFHSPSEHTINGRHFDLEMHVTHKLQKNDVDTNTTKIVSYLYDRARHANRFIREVLGEVPKTGESVQVPLVNMSRNFRAHDGAWYAYPGSITRPPCTEGVQHFVLSTVYSITEEQFQIVNRLWKGNQTFAGGHGNNRAVQALRKRNLVNSLPKEVIVPEYDFRSEGCFRNWGEPKEGDKMHLFHYLGTSKNLSVYACNYYCGFTNFSFTGISNGTDCFCSHDYSQMGHLADRDCRVRCPADKSGNYYCGGDGSTSLYRVLDSPKQLTAAPLLPLLYRPDGTTWTRPTDPNAQEKLRAQKALVWKTQKQQRAPLTTPPPTTQEKAQPVLDGGPLHDEGLIAGA